MQRVLSRKRSLVFTATGTFLLIATILAGIYLSGVFNIHAASASGYKTSWVGNSFGFKNNKWVQDFSTGIFVTPDGTLYDNSAWDEGGHELGIYKNGDVLGGGEGLHGWGRSGGSAVAADASYLYVTVGQGGCDGGNSDLNSNGMRQYPDCKTDWHAIRRYHLDGKGASFAGGYGYDGSFLIVNTNGKTLSGVVSNGKELFVSDPTEGQIKVYDTTKMSLLRSWKVERPGQLALDKSGFVWVIQESTQNVAPQLLRFSPQGQKQSQSITFSHGEKPTGMAVDKDGRLLFADNGPDQNIKIYTNITTAPKQNSTFGTKGGIFAGKVPGQVGPLRFHDLSGVGTDAKGNIYVSMGAQDTGSSTELESYTPAGVRNWRLLGLEFVDNGDIDPTHETTLYTKQEHFELDYSKANGNEWSYTGYTLNPFKYPDDPRLHSSPASAFVRYIKGQKFLFMTDMYASSLQIYRFKPSTDGEIAIPSVMITKGHSGSGWPAGHPNTQQWIWTDKNGDGKFQASEYESFNNDNPYSWDWSVDSNGTIWKGMQESGIRRFPVQGLDKNGNPIYSYASSRLEANPQPYVGVERTLYNPQTDTMYLAGLFPGHTSGDADWGRPSIVSRYDNWSKGNRSAKWQRTLPVTAQKDGGEPNAPAAISIAGDYLFSVDVFDAHVRIYSLTDGKQVSSITPGPEVGSSSGWVDIPYGISAYKRTNGEYIILTEDDAHAKIIMYRWHP